MDKQGAVPRILHQVWVQGCPPPEPAAMMAQAREVAKARSWEYWLWRARTENNGVTAVVADAIPPDGRYHYGRSRTGHPVLTLLGRCSCWAVMADIIRVAVLHEFGGLYLDADVDLWALPEGLEGAWIKSMGGDYEPSVNCAVMAAPAGHPYMARSCDAILELPGMLDEVMTGMVVCKQVLGADVNIWPYKAWRNQPSLNRPGGERATYGHHGYFGNRWGSEVKFGSTNVAERATFALHEALPSEEG